MRGGKKSDITINALSLNVENDSTSRNISDSQCVQRSIGRTSWRHHVQDTVPNRSSNFVEARLQQLARLASRFRCYRIPIRGTPAVTAACFSKGSTGTQPCSYVYACQSQPSELFIIIGSDLFGSYVTRRGVPVGIKISAGCRQVDVSVIAAPFLRLKHETLLARRTQRHLDWSTFRASSVPREQKQLRYQK